jgi:hypothetical protein
MSHHAHGLTELAEIVCNPSASDETKRLALSIAYETGKAVGMSVVSAIFMAKDKFDSAHRLPGPAPIVDQPSSPTEPACF